MSEGEIFGMEPGWQRTSGEGEANTVESFLANADLSVIKDASFQDLHLAEELEKRGYDFATLAEITDDTLDELCTDLNLKLGWRSRVTKAVQSLRNVQSVSDLGATPDGGFLTPRGNQSHPFMSKQEMIDQLCAISNLPFSDAEIEQAVKEDQTGYLDEIVIQLFATQQFDVKVVSDEELDTYAPVRTREEAKVVAKELANLEQPFRDDRIRTIVEENGWEAAIAEVSSLLDANRESLEQRLDEYKEILLDEERKCEDDEYFRSLVISEKYSTKTKRLSSVLTIYGQLHYLLMSENEEAWARDMDRLDGICREATKNEKIVQPRNAETNEFDLLELYINSVVVQLVLDGLMRPLADGLPPDRFFSSGHKSLQRSIEKMAFHLKRRWQANIWDLVRVMISFDSLEQIADALEKLLSMEQVEVFKVKNRFKREKEESWQDVLIHLRLPNIYPMICEMQFCLYKFTLARKELMGHSLYSASRLTKEIRRFIDPMGERDAESGLVFKAAKLGAKKQSDEGLFGSTLNGDEQQQPSSSSSEVEPAEREESKTSDEDLDFRIENGEDRLVELTVAGYESFLNKSNHPKYILRNDQRQYKSDTNQKFRERDRDNQQDWIVFNVKGGPDELVIPSKLIVRHDGDGWAPRAIALDVFDPLHHDEARIRSSRKDDDQWRQIGEWETEQKNVDDQELLIEKTKDNLTRKFRVRFVENWGEDARHVSKFVVEYIAIHAV